MEMINDMKVNHGRTVKAKTEGIPTLYPVFHHISICSIFLLSSSSTLEIVSNIHHSLLFLNTAVSAMIEIGQNYFTATNLKTSERKQAHILRKMCSIV